MDEMALIERFRSEVVIDPASLVRSRRRVLRRALIVSGAGRRRRRLVLASAAVVAVVAGVLALTGGGPTGSPAAAAVLSRAAEKAGKLSWPGPGEYLHVREVTTRWYDDGPETTVQERWLPGNDYEPRVFRDFEGFVYRSRSPLPKIYGRTGLSAEELLAWLRRPLGDQEGDDAAYERAGELLASDTAPPELQAALFTALRDVEGVEVVDDDAVMADRSVVIIGRGEPLETQFIFDRHSGTLVGMQGVGNPDVGNHLSYRTISTTSVTDHLPARAR
ncbi:hypothetical protein ACT8ZV_05890 [Nocardioides sp. MAHUQ-72]|uniref:hypothetical protein n=1 Tax=unclassified Nocardioides TaxID=2615069 RepID=UPI00360E1A7E